MNKIAISIALVVSMSFLACDTPSKVEEKAIEVIAEESSKAEQIIKTAIKAHGGKLYEKAHYSFTFRGSSYRFKNNFQEYEYEFEGLNRKGDSIHILLDQNVIQVWKNSKKIDLNKKQKLHYSDNLNSVIYFATLPHKLGDKSVNKFDKGETMIFEKAYKVIKVTFDQEGGGTDFDDEYYYWINSETNLIDYLAYNYQVNGGGVRFRAAYNSTKVEGVHFQDYVNYKAEVGTPLAGLPQLLEKGQLEELSRIETKNIEFLN